VHPRGGHPGNSRAPSLGLLELREAICEDYHREYGVEVTPDRIVVTSGTSPAMLLLFGALPSFTILTTEPNERPSDALWCFPQQL